MAKDFPYNQDCNREELETYWDGIKPQWTLDEAIERSREFLLSLQHPDGYWWGELEGNVTITAQTVLLYKILGIADTYPSLSKMENYIRRMQCVHGGWEIFHGDGGYLSATIEAYMALRLLNVPKSDPALQRALKVIINGGGISKSRMFTKICLALIGCYDWKGIPSLPPWIMLLPSWFPFSIYHMACWARGCVVPLTIVFDKKPVFRVSPEVSFDELYSEGRENAFFRMSFPSDWTSKFFVGVDYAFKAMEWMGLVPFRQWGKKVAEKWVVDHQDESGDFFGVYPPLFYSIICMFTLGYDVTSPGLHRAILGLMNIYSVESKNECSVQSCLSPVWDTALTVRSLVESGMKPDHPALQKAGEWLLKKQYTKYGDWACRNPSAHSGGWAFQFFNRWSPDVDDSATVVMALQALKLQDEDAKNGAIAYCIKWIESMQCKEGGWAAYDKDMNQKWLNYTPFGDLKAMVDPNTVDVTARVLEMVGRLKKEPLAAFQLPPEVIARALSYLRKEQEQEGCWYGRWGVNYIYGTCGALLALSLAAPIGTHEKEIRRGAKWLVEVQNKHGKIENGVKSERTSQAGGWGETCFSYDDPGLKGKGECGSVVSQTAWAIQGLLAAGDALGKYEWESIEKGVEYLVRMQRKDGSWHESQFTGCGFPMHFYLRYHLYAQHFSLSALSRYRAHLQEQAAAAAGC
ncbi:hypothetical protein L7F22_012212 [Adiantum nelumboides]|nr:hypothetical protein [Adiantum nelumboides]